MWCGAPPPPSPVTFEAVAKLKKFRWFEIPGCPESQIITFFKFGQLLQKLLVVVAVRGHIISFYSAKVCTFIRLNIHSDLSFITRAIIYPMASFLGENHLRSNFYHFNNRHLLDIYLLPLASSIFTLKFAQILTFLDNFGVYYCHFSTYILNLVLLIRFSI